jgi:hypothetical protein
MRDVQQAGGAPTGGDGQGLGDRVRSDAVQGRLLLVDDQALLRVRVLEVPVDVDDARGLGEDLPYGLGQLLSRGRIRRIDLGDQRLEHRRSGRYLGDRDARPIAGGDLRHRGANALGDVVALSVAIVLR